ncbi:MAG: hypothetical protein WCA11_10290 [Terracidiphilus sp.]
MPVQNRRVEDKWHLVGIQDAGIQSLWSFLAEMLAMRDSLDQADFFRPIVWTAFRIITSHLSEGYLHRKNQRFEEESQSQPS